MLKERKRQASDHSAILERLLEDANSRLLLAALNRMSDQPDSEHLLDLVAAALRSASFNESRSTLKNRLRTLEKLDLIDVENGRVQMTDLGRKVAKLLSA